MIRTLDRVGNLMRQPDFLAMVFLAAVPMIYFYPVTLGQQIWYGSDILREWIPFGTELAMALRAGRLPLWAPGMMNGFPLFAEGQVGALYPVNLVLYRLLPAYWAVSYQNLIHLIWAAWGMYVLIRGYGYGIASAILAGVIFSFNGFVISHLIHVSLITALAWLPWLVFLITHFIWARQTKKSGCWWFIALTFTIAIQVLAGSPHITLLSAITAILFGFFAFTASPEKMKWHFRWQELIWLALPWLLGLGIAAIQLIPTLELVQYSERMSRLGNAFWGSYSLPPSMLVGLFFPHDMPDHGNNELWNYVGIMPLVLAFLTPIIQRSRWTMFLVVFALSGILLAVGEVNPLFPLISRLPIINYFRAPARYMLFFLISATLLSATTFQFLSQRLTVVQLSKKHFVLAGILALINLGAIHLAHSQPWNFWWEYRLLWLGLWMASFILLGVGWLRRFGRHMFQILIIGIVLFDLFCFTAFFRYFLNPLASPKYVLAEPRAFVALKIERPYRIFTEEAGLDISRLPAIRNSLVPNIALIFRKPSANGYTPLSYEGYSPYLFNLTPAKLNLLNARYVFVLLDPLPPNGLVAPRESVRLGLTKPVTFPPTMASGIELVSFTQDVDDAPAGMPIATVILQTSDGERIEFPLRVGIETADWDYERKREQVAYDKPQVAYSFPAFWRSFGRSFTGYAYAARFDFPKNLSVVGIQMPVSEPDVHLNLVAASLYDEQGQAISIARLAGKNDFVPRFLSDTVAVWENLNYLPRAFIVHNAESFTNGLEFYRIQEPSFHPEQVVLLSGGPALSDTSALPAQDAVEILDYQPESIRLTARTDRPGYLVLLDSWYPGWNAFVDGRAVPVYRGDFLFRAIPIEAGEHTVVFEFRPLSFWLGALISVLSLGASILIAVRCKP
jgi:hypothetical protein